MKNVYEVLFFVLTAACIVNAQTTTSLRDPTGFGPCSQCRLLGNQEELQECSLMWLEIVENCSSPECAREYTMDSSINTRTCTNTPPPLPGATGTTTHTGARDNTTTRTPNSATASNSTTTSASATTSASGTTSRSTTTSASGGTSASSTTSASGTSSESETSGTSETTSPVITTRPTSTAGTGGSGGAFSQSASTAGAATGGVPGWVEGVVFAAGLIFAL